MKAVGHLHRGRKQSLTIHPVRAMRVQGMGAAKIAKVLGIARDIVYRGLDAIEAEPTAS